MKEDFAQKTSGPMLGAASIAAYYDHNTPSFMRLGGSYKVGAIHRQLWLDHVRSTEEALEALHRLAAAELLPALPPSQGRIIDLGCGVGGAMTWMATYLQVHAIGVTLSPVQTRMGNRRIQELGLRESCQILEANMLNLPDLGLFNGALAIESFSHAQSADAFFQSAASILKPGARLVLSDDFVIHEIPPSTQASRWIERFRQGWHFPSLMSLRAIQALAAHHGFRLLKTIPLGAYMRLVHPWLLHVGGFVMSMPLQSKIWQSWQGSIALQICLRKGWTEYALLVWERE